MNFIIHSRNEIKSCWRSNVFKGLHFPRQNHDAWQSDSTSVQRVHWCRKSTVCKFTVVQQVKGSQPLPPITLSWFPQQFARFYMWTCNNCRLFQCVISIVSAHFIIPLDYLRLLQCEVYKHFAKIIYFFAQYIDDAGFSKTSLVRFLSKTSAKSN